MKNFKNIHIGEYISLRMEECEISLERASDFLDISEEEVERSYLQQSLDTEILLRWSKLLKYDFFRLYSQHLILYCPQISTNKEKKQQTKALPMFRKNIYSTEVIRYLIDLLDNKKKTIKQIQEEYNIPTTTILRWVDKYKK